MKTFAAIVVLFFQFVCVAQAEEAFTAFGSTVVFVSPDPSKWNLVHNGMVKDSKGHLLMFECNPIKDAEGRNVRPVIAIICEQVPDSLDVIKYSIWKRTQIPLDVKKVMTYQDGSLTYRNSVGYEGEYVKGVVHKVFVAHMRHKQVGLQVICDSTDGVYDKVEADMRDFLRSITFKE
ncbi:MAG: hypothetical protein ACOYXY_22725 [Thermodesulfobacteriota bacterium]